jgi:acyl-CoA dehydrogenase
MKINLNKNTQKWQKIAREYADEFLQPHEVEAELNNGELSKEITKRNKERAVELGFTAIDVPKKYGGLELSMVEQVAIWEQLGRVTNALSWCFPEAQSWMFEACSEQQIEKYILPMVQGLRKDCYAITESESGSDVANLKATAKKIDNGYVLNGEKWFVTSANLADFFWFQAYLPDEEEDALFLVDIDTVGIEMIASPLFSHTYAAHHPTYQFKNVQVDESQRVGKTGDGMSYTHSWFRHERLMIGARSCGASRLMTFEAATADDNGMDVKTLHNRCSMVKLFVSEAANRIADRVVQIFGGRGYMRENVAERFYRELRCDRIWEGTSEIQKLIIARSLKKRGLDGM